jgi:hypothetical protein
MKAPDFKEGIRALLVDKDNNPKWNPSTIESVTEENMNGYFKKLGPYELQLNFD